MDPVDANQSDDGVPDAGAGAASGAGAGASAGAGAGAGVDASAGVAPKKSAPGIVAPSTRVTVAFPFSTVKIQEPGEVLVELATLVADLAHLIDRRSDSPDTADLAEEADALVERLRKAH